MGKRDAVRYYPATVETFGAGRCGGYKHTLFSWRDRRRGERRTVAESLTVGRLSEPVGTIAPPEPLTVPEPVTVPNPSPSPRRTGTPQGAAGNRDGANPSERRERHGGLLWRVWREPVGRLSAGVTVPNLSADRDGEPLTVGRSGAAIVRTCRRGLSARDRRHGCHGERLRQIGRGTVAPVATVAADCRNGCACRLSPSEDRHGVTVAEPVGVTVGGDCRQIGTANP